MLLWLLLPVSAWATTAAPGATGPCADVPAQVEVAWAAYNEAELEKAKALLAEAYGNLACQRAVLSADALLALYRLDALVSLTQDDRKGAVYATIRAVAVDHEAADPPPEYGPELAELYDTWSTRLGEMLVTVTVADGGTAWVDGRRVAHDAPLKVVEGEHLVQIEGIGGVTSEVREVAIDLSLTTGIPLVAPSDPEEVPVAAPVAPLPPKREAGRRRPAALIVTGGLGAALGGAALASAWRSESSFLADDYHRGAYDGCEQGTRCYASAREAAIAEDAQLIRMLYVGGYAFSGLGAGLLGIGIVGLPVRTDGRTVSVDVRW